MGHDDHGHVFLRQIADHLQNLAGQLRVQRRCRFIKKEYLGIHRQCPGDGHALLLSAGKLTGIGVLLVGQPHLFQKLAGALLRLALVAAQHAYLGIHEIFQHRIVGKQVEALEHEAELFPYLLQLALIGIDRLAVRVVVYGLNVAVDQLAGVHLGQQCGTAQQRGLTAAGGTDNGDDLALLHGEADVLQHVQRLVIKALLHVVHLQ